MHSEGHYRALAGDIAQAMLDGFNRHYRLFRSESVRAKHRFETADWHGQQRAQRERIEFYDVRVRECVRRLDKEFAAGQQSTALWHDVKRHYITLLVAHRQPELAETFFNSVTTKILHRTHFHNDFIFVRPAVSTEYIQGAEARPTYRAWYPQPGSLHATLVQVLQSYDLQRPFAQVQRDCTRVLAALEPHLAALKLRANFQIQVLTSLFYRNKGAYLVGKVINGFHSMPFALPLLHNEAGQLVIDAVLWGEDELLALFSFARAYFMVDMEVPSAYVQFLQSLMPRKPVAEIYTALGLAKQGKTLFYREFLWHLQHSSDQLRIAPGIKGMVMLVFDLPSFPYVFKLIKDEFPPQKDTTRAQVQAKYQLVKHHDRVGRMADTLEYSLVALPLVRFSDALLAELRQHAPSQIEISDRDGDGQQEVIISHLYIERRMVPLNLYLQEAFDAGLQHASARQQMERSVIDYGNAIKDLIAANIFPGDMLWKNFGVTRGGKVVFYDYDEIEYLTDCQFRAVPPPRNEEDELSGEIWWKVGPRDVFPETFAPFLLGHPAVRDVFLRHHADLLTPQYWQIHQERIRSGHVYDVFPYPATSRFGAVQAPGSTHTLSSPSPFPDPPYSKELTMSHSDPVVIVSAARTPMGSFQGDFAALAAHDLGGVAIRAAVARAGIAPESVQEVIFGNVLMAGQGQAPARQALLKGGLPTSTGAVTLHKVCGSAMKAVMLGADMIAAGSADVVVAGGMESMTNAPYLLKKGRGGYRLGHDKVYDHMMLDGLEDAYEEGRSMGTFGEDCAQKYQFTRAQQDAFAMASVQRAQAAIASGAFQAEIAPVTVKDRKGERSIETDEGPGKINPEKIPTLKPAFKKDGTITAAASSSINDGAAALVLMRQSRAQALGLQPLARIVSHATHAQEPSWFTTAPVPAAQKALEKAGWSVAEVDLWEINEAFAIVPMALMHDLNVPHEKVNVHGGACALGHPIGASGARIIVTLLYALQARGLKKGLATLCIGGGEATALALELV